MPSSLPWINCSNARERFDKAKRSPPLYDACITGCVNLHGYCEDCNGKAKPREWPPPVPAAELERQVPPDARQENKRAADRVRAARHRAKVRAERIAAGWIPPEEREYKMTPEERAAARERAARHRQRRREEK